MKYHHVDRKVFFLIMIYILISWNIDKVTMYIKPHTNCNCGMQAPSEPLYLLYFEDAHFRSPHYQSIRPKGESNSSHPQQVINQIIFEHIYF